MSANTVWLASYPKSGNTWIRALLTGLEQDDELDINRLGQGPIASAREPMRAWLGIPTSDLTPVEAVGMRLRFDAELDAGLEQVRFRKIHDGLFTGPDWSRSFHRRPRAGLSTSCAIPVRWPRASPITSA